MPRSTPTPSLNSPTQRLPVNPRRHRVPPEQRKRVAIACNNCNVRRIKCSGERPCQQCSSSSRDCQYPVAVDKVTVPRSELEELRARCALLERCFEDAVPDPAQRQLLLSSGMALSGDAAAESPGSREGMPLVDDDQPETGGKLLQDLDGTSRYMGETSGATFLDNVKAFMATIFPLAFNVALSDTSSGEHAFLSSVGRYQTHDSRPLVAPLVDPLWLPPPEEMVARLGQLRYFMQEDGGVSGGVLYWGNLHDLPEPPRRSASGSLTAQQQAQAQAQAQAQGGASPLELRNNRRLAFHQASFAYSALLGLTTPGSKQDGHIGETFFARARMLLGNPLDVSASTSDDVVVMVLMGLYLIEMNRRDACYMYIVIAMHVAIMHGVHRGWSVDEHGKRTFWTAYVLDRWVSCLMGRPPTILDEGISLDLPQEVPGMPTAIGLRANVELARIAGYIVCNTYRIAPWADVTAHKMRSHVDKALQMLSEWLHGLPPQLQMSYESFSPDRPLCTLHMSYNQLLILTIRPILFMAVKRAVADRFVSRQWNIEDHPQIGHIRECSDAARRNLRLGRWLQKISPAQKLLMPDLHNVFNAAIVLLLHQIVFVNLRTGDVSDIAFAVEAFEREAGFGDIYGADCGRILKELSALVHRLRNLMFEGVPQTIGPHALSGPLEPTSAATAVAAAAAAAAAAASAAAAAAASASAASSSAAALDQAAAAAAAAATLPTFGLMPLGVDPDDGSNPIIPIQMPVGDALYQELVTWLDNDDMKMYSSYLV